MNKMNFYKLIEQQYNDYKSKYDILSASCEGCPCKTLREKVFGTYEQTGCTNEQTDCTNEIAYLVDKYKIDDVNVFLCDECMIASLKIAKKLFEKKEFNKI